MPTDAPAPYLTSYFYPGRLKVPPKRPGNLCDELQTVAAEIQSERYGEAARHLVAHCDKDPQLILVAAECFLHADDPAAAQGLLSRHLPPDGNWALACALVQQQQLEGALEPLALLDRVGRLRDERRTAAALLLAHLGRGSLGDGLPDLTLSSEELARAREAGYRWFIGRAVGEIERTDDATAVGQVVERVRAQCLSLTEAEAWRVLAPVYEAAVRATGDCCLATQAVDRILSHPELLGDDDEEYSRALLFATISERADELEEVLRQPADGPARHARCLSAAKLSLVRDDVDGIEANSARAMHAASPTNGLERATGLYRAGRSLVCDDAPQFSQWALRSLHPHLPPVVADRLEDRNGRFLAAVAERARRSEVGRQAVDIASTHLEQALEIDSTSRDRIGLQQAIGHWASHIAIAMLEADWDRPLEPAAYAEAARRLLGPAPPPLEVIATLARALAYYYAGASDRQKVRNSLDMVIEPLVDGTAVASAFMQQVLAEWEHWQRTGRAAPGELVEDVSASLQPVSTEPGQPYLLVPAWLADQDLPPGVREMVEVCFADRLALLPDTAPFRGPRWFESDDAHRLYQEGRSEKDALESFRAFEDAWMLEPNGVATTQGLIHGLRRRIREQRGRIHVLERRAQILDQRVDREVEAALAWRTLADLAERGSPEWRSHLASAAVALRRGSYRRPWTRARNVEIALELELGDAAAAGDAAWAEAHLWLPGDETSRRYALLAATLWDSSRSVGRPTDERVAEAVDRSRRPPVTNPEAVRYAVATGWLDALATVDLDERSLEELWRACQGDEGKVRRSLERQARDEVAPKPAYLQFLSTKLEPAGQSDVSELPSGRPDAVPGAEPSHLAELRLATAELLAHDVLEELANPPAFLCHVTVRRFLAALRASAGDDRAAYERFSTKVEDALAALFDLRHAIPVSRVEPYGGRLARARAAVFDMIDGARMFAGPTVARLTFVVGRHLATGLNEPTTRDYVREKRMRLVPSRLGLRLGEWYSKLRQVSGSQDFFHQHHHYRYQSDLEPAEWLQYHHVLGSPAGEAISILQDSLALHAKHLAQIEAEYRSKRSEADVGLHDFGLTAALRDGIYALHKALAPEPTRDDLRAIAGTLKAMSDSLRGLDLTRLAHTDGLLKQHGLPDGRYLIPRGAELLTHWRDNVGDHPTLRANFEFRDDAGRNIFCTICLDEEPTEAPEWTALRGLAPYADVVDALGGQLHLWMARPGQRSRCRRQDHRGCAADEYVIRIEQRLRELSANQWYSEQATVEKWLSVLQRALHGQQSATLSFVVFPSLQVSGG